MAILTVYRIFDYLLWEFCYKTTLLHSRRFVSKIPLGLCPNLNVHTQKLEKGVPQTQRFKMCRIVRTLCILYLYIVIKISYAYKKFSIYIVVKHRNVHITEHFFVCMSIIVKYCKDCKEFLTMQEIHDLLYPDTTTIENRRGRQVSNKLWNP